MVFGAWVTVCAAVAISTQAAPPRPAAADPAAVVHEAKQLAAAGRLDDAQRAIEGVLERRPESIPALLALGGQWRKRASITARPRSWHRA